MTGPPPPPPQYAQQHPQQPQYVQQHPPQSQVMYNQPTTHLGVAVNQGGMMEVCPNCRQTVMMIQHRNPTMTAYCWACLACFFLGGAVIGILIAIWLLMYSDCVDISFSCPSCGFIARQVQGQ